MKIGNRVFENYTYVMAIVNLTPDSFWQGSRNTSDSVLYAVERAVRDGASVIDLGPQSTRPGYTEISAEDEIERFAKPLELVKRNFEVPVSVDTYFEKSAKVALELGADMINDIWGLTHDAGMAKPLPHMMRRSVSCTTRNIRFRGIFGSRYKAFWRAV